jgi:hypothetical protein
VAAVLEGANERKSRIGRVRGRNMRQHRNGYEKCGLLGLAL